MWKNHNLCDSLLQTEIIRTKIVLLFTHMNVFWIKIVTVHRALNLQTKLGI